MKKLVIGIAALAAGFVDGMRTEVELCREGKKLEELRWRISPQCPRSYLEEFHQREMPWLKTQFKTKRATSDGKPIIAANLRAQFNPVTGSRYYTLMLAGYDDCRNYRDEPMGYGFKVDVTACLKGAIVTKLALGNRVMRRIGNAAFKCERLLVSVTLPIELQHIAPAAFMGCCKLQLLRLPSNLKTIQSEAFRDSGLMSMDFSSCIKLNYIGEYAFRGTSLRTVDLSGTLVKIIGAEAFGHNNQLITVTFPSTLEHLGRSAFDETSIETLDLSHCERLNHLDHKALAGGSIKYVLLPDGLRSIDADALGRHDLERLRTPGWGAAYLDLTLFRSSYYCAPPAKCVIVTDLASPPSAPWISINEDTQVFCESATVDRWACLPGRPG